jgi:hypothetical protein
MWVSFHCSEICTQHDDGTRQITIFKGLFFVVKISEHFTGGTYAWARGEEQLPATIYEEEYLLMHMPPVHDIRFAARLLNTISGCALLINRTQLRYFHPHSGNK